MSWRISKGEWARCGGLRGPNVFRKLNARGRYSYWRIF